LHTRVAANGGERTPGVPLTLTLGERLTRYASHYKMLRMESTMPRPPSDNTEQVALRVSEATLTQADHLIPFLSHPGVCATRADVLRAALVVGLQALAADHVSRDEGDPLDAAGPWELDRKHLVLRHHETPGYDVDLERMATSAQVLDWLMQQAGKTWVGTSDLGILVRLLKHLLNPQEGMCGGAMASARNLGGKIDPTERVRSRLAATKRRKRLPN
jgi:hypothetical protein